MSAHQHDEKEEHDGCDHEHGEANPWPTRSLVVAATLTVAVLVLQWTRVGPDVLFKTLAAAAVVLGGWFLLPSAWQAVRGLRPNINLLMVIAVTGALVVGEWAEGATVVVLFGVAEWLEGWADRRAQRATAALLELGMGFHPDFTGRQNAYMAGQLLGYTTDEITQIFII